MIFAKTVLLTTALSCFAFKASAWAGYDNDCSKLPKGDKVACAAKAKTKCAAVKGYWPKRKCVAKVAKGFDLCLKDGTFTAMCAERKAAYWDVCMKAGELDMNKPETLPEFKRRALAYASTLKKAQDFAAEWGVCYTPGIRVENAKCGVTHQDLPACERAAETYKKSMRDTLDWFLKTTMPNVLTQIDKMMAGKSYAAAKRTAVSTQTTIASLQKLNHDLPKLAHRIEDLERAAKKFQIMEGLIVEIAAKAKATVRCPRGKFNKKRLVKAMRGSVKDFFGTGTHARKVKKLRLVGKKTVTRKAYRNETTESYPAVACTEGLPTSENAGVCQVFSISVKRTRRGRKPWAPWTTYVGNSVEMLCKNLK